MSMCMTPGKIGTMELRNRIILPPIVACLDRPDGYMSERHIAYLERRAKGGAALITVEATSVHPTGKGFHNSTCIDRDELIPGLRKAVEAIHRHGAKANIEIHHAGRQTTRQNTGQDFLLCASDWHGPGEFARAMTKEEIHEIVAAYGQAARRAKEAGFDCVEIHGAHGYLITQFTSRYTNHRTDEYGGSLENRCRFPLEVIRSVRAAVGDDFPVMYRLSAAELVPNGLDIEETLKIIPILLQEHIDGLSVSLANYESVDYNIPVMAIARENIGNIERAAKIKELVTRLKGDAVKVMTVGRMTPDLAEKTLQAGHVDFVGIARGLLCDPDLPNKIAAGKQEEILRCLSCNEGCVHRLFLGEPITCAINPMVGHEFEYAEFTRTACPMNVIVVGGGPAGMAAAAAFGAQGHNVALYDRHSHLGGLLRTACLPPFKEEVLTFVEDKTAELHRLGVNVFLNKEMSAEEIQALKPQLVIVATGGRPLGLKVPGAENVGTCMAGDILTGAVSAGKKVIIIGGGMVGSETAEFLAQRGHEVTLVEMRAELSHDADATVRFNQMRRFAELTNIKTLLNTKVLSLSPTAIVVESPDGQKELGGFDTTIVAIGMRADTTLRDELALRHIQTEVIGDCTGGGNIMKAVHAAFNLARKYAS